MSAGLRAAVREAAISPDLEPALQALVDEYGRASGAIAAMLATGSSKAMPVGSTWLYEAIPQAADSADGAILDDLARQLRDEAESPFDPGREVVWKSRNEGGATCDFIAAPVRVDGLPPAALCAALHEPAEPPDAIAAVTGDFAALAGLCLLAHSSTGGTGSRPPGARPSCLAASEIRGTLAAELSRCRLSRESVAVCFVAPSAGPSADGSRDVHRLMTILGQVLAEAGHPYDFVGRLDSAGLLIVMPGTDHDGGVATARHLMRVARLALGATGGEGLHPSFRIAEWDRSEDADALLRRVGTEVRGEG